MDREASPLILTDLTEIVGECPEFSARFRRSLERSGWLAADLIDGRGPSAPDPRKDRAFAGVMGDFLVEVQRRTGAAQLVVYLGEGRGDSSRLWSIGFAAPEEAASWLREWWDKVGEDTSEASPQPGTIVSAPVFICDQLGGEIVAVPDSGKDLGEKVQRELLGAGYVLGSTISVQIAEGRGYGVLYAMIQSLTAALDARDTYTRGHSDRVTIYAMAVANELDGKGGMGQHQQHQDRLRLGALLHDIGKVGIRDDILYKPESLSEEELKKIEEHPLLGARIVSSSGTLDHIIPGILYHHERHDGSGYPAGLKGEEIPLTARIIGISDAFDAMTTDRPYCQAVSHEEALRIIREKAGILFDPRLVDALSSAHQKGVLSRIRFVGKARGIQVAEETRAIERRRLTRSGDIPPLPAVVGRLNEMLLDDRRSAADIADLISTDEGLVVRILRIANSAFYALPSRVGTIPTAVTLLGMTTLRNIVIGTAMADVTASLLNNRRDAKKLWNHGVAVGVWARTLARQVGGVDPEEAFTSGLIHDIGKGIVLRELDGSSSTLRERLVDARDWRVIERDCTGLDHSQLGAWAANRWGLPPTLTLSTRFHHEPREFVSSDIEMERLVWIVHLADVLARAEDENPPAIKALLEREADPLVAGMIPFGDEAFWSDLIPQAAGDREIARQLFTEAAAGTRTA